MYLEHTQGSVSGGDDEVVAVPGRAGREGRRHVEDELAAGDGFGPTSVGGEVRDDKTQRSLRQLRASNSPSQPATVLN